MDRCSCVLLRAPACSCVLLRAPACSCVLLRAPADYSDRVWHQLRVLNLRSG